MLTNLSFCAEPQTISYRSRTSSPQGYRKYGDYDFWAVFPNNDQFEWKKVGVFKSDANTTYVLTPISKKLDS